MPVPVTGTPDILIPDHGEDITEHKGAPGAGLPTGATEAELPPLTG